MSSTLCATCRMPLTEPDRSVCRECIPGPAEQQPETPPTWAIVSLMGHKSYAGRLSEEERFGHKLGRIDIPEEDGGFRTVYFGGASVYSIQVVTEAVARHASHHANPTPVSPWDFPKQLAQAPLVLDENDVEDDDPPDYEPEYPV